jgi:hypothetical protein
LLFPRGFPGTSSAPMSGRSGRAASCWPLSPSSPFSPFTRGRASLRPSLQLSTNLAQFEDDNDETLPHFRHEDSEGVPVLFRSEEMSCSSPTIFAQIPDDNPRYNDLVTTALATPPAGSQRAQPSCDPAEAPHEDIPTGESEPKRCKTGPSTSADQHSSSDPLESEEARVSSECDDDSDLWGSEEAVPLKRGQALDPAWHEAIGRVSEEAADDYLAKMAAHEFGGASISDWSPEGEKMYTHGPNRGCKVNKLFCAFRHDSGCRFAVRKILKVADGTYSVQVSPSPSRL